MTDQAKKAEGLEEIEKMISDIRLAIFQGYQPKAGEMWTEEERLAKFIIRVRDEAIREFAEEILRDVNPNVFYGAPGLKRKVEKYIAEALANRGIKLGKEEK